MLVKSITTAKESGSGHKERKNKKMANIKDVIKNGDRFVDVFFGMNVPTNVSFFLYGASPVKKCYKNETISFTEYTPTQKIERSITFSAEEQRQRCAQKRYDCYEIYACTLRKFL